MANQPTTWTDIDISLTKNLYNDISVLRDVNSIRNSLYNILFISSTEQYWTNVSKTSIQNYIHQPFNFIVRKQIEDVIRDAVKKEPRIIKIQNIEFTELPNEYKLQIDIIATVKLKNDTVQDTQITLVVDRQ